jgi:chemotaxis response regulator CheB
MALLFPVYGRFLGAIRHGALRGQQRQCPLAKCEATSEPIALTLVTNPCYRIAMKREATPWFVAVGASGGEGLADIRELLAALPAPLEAVMLIVLHRPADRPSNLRTVLASSCAHPIVIAAEGQKFERGTVYIGEPSEHLTLAEQSFGTLLQDPERSYRGRTIDLLFRSVAENGKDRVIGVVLSGALDDGSRGLALIHAAGGLTMVLTPRSPPTQGMPEHAIAYDGPIDLIGTPSQIASAIIAAIQG